MSNNLFDITTNTTNDTYTLSDNLTNIITIKDNLGNTIPYNIDLTNNYIYWLFGINDLSYNITTTVDINNLGFVIAGDCNNYPSVCTLDTNYYGFRVISSCVWSGDNNATDPNKIMGTTGHNFIIDSSLVIVPKYSNTGGGDLSTYIYRAQSMSIPGNPKWYGYTALNTTQNSDGLSDTQYSYVNNSLTDTPVQLKNVPSSNANIMTCKISSFHPGACGGITKGNIRQFTTTQNIQIYKKNNSKTYSYIIPATKSTPAQTITHNDIISSNCILNYSYNDISYNIITSSAVFADVTKDGVISINNSGSGESLQNNQIQCTFFNGTNSIPNNAYAVNIVNATTQQLPSINVPFQQVNIQSNILTNTCQIPFILDNNLTTNFNMYFNDLSKNIIINGSGISENHQINYNYTGLKNMYVYNWSSKPYFYYKYDPPPNDLGTPALIAIIPKYSKQNLSIINYPSVTFGKPLTLNDRAKGKKTITEFKPVLAKGSSNFALVYYNFSKPITITKNITTLNIDLAIASRITLDLSSITYSNVNYNFIYTLRVNNLNKLTVISGSLNSNSKIFDIVYNYVGGKQKKVTWYINIIA
jgi:hypothetical protein